MDSWILYILLTITFYIISTLKLKARTEKERVGSTRICLMAIIFFAIFEFAFIESIAANFILHLIGLLVSILYSLSIYFYLISRKKEIDIIFDKMLQENQGLISVLSFMQATQLSQNKVQQYLNKKLKKLKGSRHKTPGNIYYQFNQW